MSIAVVQFTIAAAVALPAREQIRLAKSYEHAVSVLWQCKQNNPDLLFELGTMRVVAEALFDKFWAEVPTADKAGTKRTDDRNNLGDVAVWLIAALGAPDHLRGWCAQIMWGFHGQLSDNARRVADDIFRLYGWERMVGNG